uniref:DUF4218 domain-containing protein n=1 Tax=Oryza brachyantha TaxID=4533 RepID=J3N7A8_ORYBR
MARSTCRVGPCHAGRQAALAAQVKNSDLEMTSIFDGLYFMPVTNMVFVMGYNIFCDRKQLDLNAIKKLLLFPRPSDRYLAGVEGFLDFAYREKNPNDKIRCPFAHLATEAKIGGPVCYRLTYFVERMHAEEIRKTYRPGRITLNIIERTQNEKFHEWFKAYVHPIVMVEN